jgi:hypothetical protein
MLPPSGHYPVDTVRHRPLLETRAEHFLRVLEAGKVSTRRSLRGP